MNELRPGQPVASCGYTDGTVTIKIYYEHGDADANTDQILTFQDAGVNAEEEAYVIKVCQALKMFMEDYSHDQSSKEIKEMLSTIFLDDTYALSNFMSDVLVRDVVYDHQYYAKVEGYDAHIWVNGIEYTCEVFVNDNQIN